MIGFTTQAHAKNTKCRAPKRRVVSTPSTTGSKINPSTTPAAIVSIDSPFVKQAQKHDDRNVENPMLMPDFASLKIFENICCEGALHLIFLSAQ